MAVVLIGTAGPKYGIPVAELGVDVESITADYSPQFIKEKNDSAGIVNCVAYGPMELSLSMSGKTTTGTSGPLRAVLGTAFVPAGTYSSIPLGTPITAAFGSPTTGLYLEKASMSYSEGDFYAFSVDFKARAGIT